MLAPDDAGLAARHPALPGLGLLLDPEALAAAVDRLLPDLGVESARATYVRLKPGTSCVVGVRLGLPGGRSLDGYARTCAAADDPKLRKSAARAADRGAGGALLDTRTALLLHPHDHDLPAVARLADAARRPVILGRALDGPPREGWELEALRHNPERRWVARLTDPAGRRMLLKVHRPPQHRRAVAGAIAFAAAPAPASRLVGSSRRHGITVHGWVDGRSAVEVLPGATGPAEDRGRLRRRATDAAGDIGGLLARLHRADLSRAARRLGAAPDERQALALGVAAVTALHPGAGGVASRIAERIVAQLAASAGECEPRLLHGDCSVDQVVLTADGPVLIDVDRAACGEPSTDLAQLLADLAVRRAGGALPDDGPLASAVLDGYSGAGGRVDSDRLAALTAARLLRMAPEPFRRRQPGWGAALQVILDRAAALVGAEVAA